MMPIFLITDSVKQINDYVEIQFGEEETYSIHLQPQSTEYSIDQIRGLIRETNLYQPRIRIYILEKFDHASLEAQNSFLKLLEEPPENVDIILTGTNSQSLISTILSRVKIVKLDKKKLEEPDKIIGQKLLAAINDPFTYLSDPLFTVSSKETASVLLLQFLLFYRQRLSTDVHAAAVLKEVLFLHTLLDRNNLNPQLCIDHLLIFIGKLYNVYTRYSNYKRYKK